METQHTSGPWAVNPFIAQVDCGVIDEFGAPLPVASLLWPTGYRSEAETEANAHLIAAAPEMLQVLDKYADDMCEGWCEQSPDCAHFEDCAGCLARRTAWTARGVA